MDKTKAYQILLDVKDIVPEFWLDAGTCLGAVRENDFMDSDFDVDIGVFADNSDSDKIIEGLRDNGFIISHHKKHPSGVGQQISCIKYNISLDIFFYYKVGNNTFRVMFDITPIGTKRFFTIHFPNDILLTFKQIDFMSAGVMFNIPYESEKYLEIQYGDWRTDKKPSEFRWQYDYLNMREDFVFWDKCDTKPEFVMIDDIKPTCSMIPDDKFFDKSIREGYKLFPIYIDEDNNILDGNRRYYAYKRLDVPMLEVYKCIKKQ